MYKRLSKFIQSRNTYRPATQQKEKTNIPPSFKQAQKTQTPLEGYLDSEVKGGFRIWISGQMAFCPYSEMYPKPLDDKSRDKLKRKLNEYLIIELKPQSVIVSRKRAVRAETWMKIKKSYSRKGALPGTVKNVQEYGVFVDLGCVDGLLHKSEIGYGRSDCYQIGRVIWVDVSNFDEKDGRVSLSLVNSSNQP